MAATAITDAVWDAEVLQTEGSVVVGFWSRWSTPCQGFLHVVDQLSSDLRGVAKVLTFDLDDNPLMVRRYEVSSLPTVLWFCGGRLSSRVVGSCSKERLLREIGLYPT